MYVRVHALPGSKKESVTKESDTVFYIAVKEPAERNCANRRIQAILAQEFDVLATQVKMVTGHRSGSKMYSIEIEKE